MDQTEIARRIALGRNFTKCAMDGDDGFVSDQQQRLPQPPLVKAAMRERALRLPHDFDNLALAGDYARLVGARRTRRVYTGEAISLLQLSFLLWASQGVESVRGKSYATLRTVPSGGARHAFETYLVVNSVEGLAPGAYHYLPMTHALEFLNPVDNREETVSEMLMGQSWAAKASVVFIFSFVPYRAEWRYGIYAHRVVMIDLGHVGQALYMAAEAMELGTCGIGAFSQAACDRAFSLDGQEEYAVYAQPVGRYADADAPKELEFYAFLKERE
ncbi:MAG: Nitroreductase family protein [Firmicutes bacterium ADurb.Bin248]|nr:MAG: Nitroreductase family protein [Firmicutes bacterium ADurb.Bin248]HOG01758.1 SagB/ThcOx family dehydrogenase [Clostridia bacterium]HPK14586.1 SagB/ThcOx family dehydrogenase [Clostridia bacterium]